MNVLRALTVFAVIFPAELPDKTFIATLLMGSRMNPLAVWAGASSAFAVHVGIAVGAGSAFALLPHRVVQLIVSAMFIAGAAYLLISKEEEQEEEGAEFAGHNRPGAPSFLAIASRSFGVIFLAEWGDITQVATANLAAKYSDPLSVAVGAIVALVLVAAIGVLAGSRLLRLVPLGLVRRVGGAILLALGLATLVQAL